MPVVSLPPYLQCALDGWGPGMLDAARRAGARHLASTGGVSPHMSSSGEDLLCGATLVLGTDCSGADAPVWALRPLWPGRPFVHAFACDNWRDAETVVKANTKCIKFFPDMLSRPLEQVPHHNLYVCGFPCQPFSTLHHKTRLFHETKAKPFRAMLCLLQKKRPAVAVLENVPGILRVRERLERSLKGIGGYCITILRLDPRSLGELVSRPRLYIVCVRLDVLACTSRCAVDQLASEVLRSLAKPVKCSAVDRLLPNSHSLVRNRLAMESCPTGSRNTSPLECLKWHEDHRAFREQLSHVGKSVARLGGVPPLRLVSSARAREAWALQILANPLLTTADVSQGIHRIHGREDGCLPTVTPESCIVVRPLNRAMIGLEKLLVHGFPVHRLDIPEMVTESDLHRLGGQTMHVQCVAAAILVGCALVDWNKPASKSGVVPHNVAASWPVSWLGSWPQNMRPANSESPCASRPQSVATRPKRKSAKEHSSASRTRHRFTSA